MRAAVAAVLLAAGVAFIGIASIGVARLPDVFQRMHAATKAGGIGTSLVVLGVLVAGGVVRSLDRRAHHCVHAAFALGRVPVAGSRGVPLGRADRGARPRRSARRSPRPAPRGHTADSTSRPVSGSHR